MSTAIASAAAPVDSTKVTGRRELHFNTLDDILVDANGLAAMPMRPLGNWSVGQATGHLARAMQMSLDGFADPRAPLPIRLFLKLLKKRLLTKGLRPGFKLRGPAAEKSILDRSFSTEQGLNELRTNIDRLKREPQRHPHPAFGVLTRAEWEQLHLRHAELHLSFFVPA
jgi:hypothetical protein